jgi:chorismate mutase
MENTSTPPTQEPPELRAIRGEIDRLDQEILDLMARRFGFAIDTLAVKERHGLLASDVRREAHVVRTAAMRARELGLEPELVRDIYWRIIELSRQAQRRLAAGATAEAGTLGEGAA